MEWQVKPLARVSAVDGAPFAIGEKVLCFLFRNEEGHLARDDIRSTEESGYRVPTELLARWAREVKPAGEEEKQARRQALETAEDLFLALFDDELPDVATDRDALKVILGLMLERKRILRAQGKRGKDSIRYLHVRTKTEYRVPARDLTPAEAIRIQDDLQHFVL